MAERGLNPGAGSIDGMAGIIVVSSAIGDPKSEVRNEVELRG
jgi:hypothetical protein